MIENQTTSLGVSGAIASDMSSTVFETTVVTSESTFVALTFLPPTISFHTTNFDDGQIGGVTTAVVCILGLAGDFAFLLFA